MQVNNKINTSSLFTFREDLSPSSYNIYIFKDFSELAIDDINREVLYRLDVIRQRVHVPATIYIISNNPENFHKEKLLERINKTKIEYIGYPQVSSKVLSCGISTIAQNNRVVQHAPFGTIFKKTSQDETTYFIKASLALQCYPEICFMALALYHRITPQKLSSIDTLYIDTSAIFSLALALIKCFNVIDCSKLNPKIVNFKSYDGSYVDIDFNTGNSFTLISASTSGNLQAKLRISDNNCLTIFLSNHVHSENYLCQVNISDDNCNAYKLSMPTYSRVIPLTSEDFSLEYSVSQEVILTKIQIQKMDTGNLIEKILADDFIGIDYEFIHDDIKGRQCISFNSEFLYEAIKKVKFIDKIFYRALSLELDNLIIFQHKDPKEDLNKVGKLKLDDFLKLNVNSNCINGNTNVIVFLVQSTNHQLLMISQRLREFKPANVTYVVGALLTANLEQSKNLKNNICFNNTDYKYSFFCYLDLPILEISPERDIKAYKLTDGFVLYKGKGSKKLSCRQIYITICLVFELLRSNGKLVDNISYHDVVSPKNFSRFNDSLLQLCILQAAKGRELNFSTNIDLSREMRDVIVDLLISKKDVGLKFITALYEGQIKLVNRDYAFMKNEYSDLFDENSRKL